MNEFLSACDVLVFTPSPTEGAPRVITEAQLVGIPVIAIAEPGAVDLIRPGAGTLVSPPNDPRATAAPWPPTATTLTDGAGRRPVHARGTRRALPGAAAGALESCWD